MDIRETISVAIDALRANKLRAILTSLGVIIGSASIVLVVTVALTSRKFVLSQIEAVGSNLIQVELVQRPDKPQPLSYEMTLEDLEAVRGIPNVIEVAGTRELPMTVVVGGVERPVNLVGVTAGYQAIRRLVVLRGRYLDAGDMEMRSKVCLITTQLADRIFGQENPVGRPIRMGELTFTVIGVFRERVETFGLSDIQENSVILPYAHEVLHRRGSGAFAGCAGGAGGGRPVRRAASGPTIASPTSLGSGIQSANADGDTERGEKYLARTDHRADHHCVHRTGDQRSRDHEHHARHGDRADQGNRNPQGDRCGATRNSVPVFDRILLDQRGRRGSRNLDWNRRAGDHPIFFAGKSAGSGVTAERDHRVCRVVFNGTVLRVFARESGGEPATGRVPEI